MKLRIGVAAGGSAIEDPPGVREGSTGKRYLAYPRDGNKLCALHRKRSACVSIVALRICGVQTQD